MGYDPTKPSYGTEETRDIRGVPVTIRVTVQDGQVVAGSFSVGIGEGLGPRKTKEIPWEAVAQRALKEAPAEEDA